ncbi:MAG: hypothetical protein MZU91_03270 [Desulfosudis oleivorans]|nr:hypothetical protein [Desulfosudis oleivorans]
MTSHRRGHLGITHQLSLRSTIHPGGWSSYGTIMRPARMSSRSNGSWRFEQAVLQALSLGFVISYNHGDRGDLSR